MEPAGLGVVGAYRLVEVLGEGGMGRVYLAEQSEPVRRNVALKVLKPGSDSEQVLSRFNAERQALAVMDHPSIAKVFDAGVTEDGRSYFAMELVTGATLRAFCDENRLTVVQRVELFAEVCRAVQHAHQKGVIHRDLKPSNILVSLDDDRPYPRIIDFGIAKATGAGAFDGTQLTRDDQVIGTPAYMSPEQIDGSGDVDTRTDVYALGVILYEILAGALPYDSGAYRGWAAVAAQLHREPPTLVRRFAELAETQETIADCRSTTPTMLRRDLAGDLGWIVAQAMEKDREERYETVNAMALDLERYLAHEPVRARGASTTYVVRKFVRRNRVGVAFGATVALGLAGFAVVTSIQAERISVARDEAVVRRGQAESLIDFMLSDLRDKLTPIGRLDVLDDVGAQATQYFSTIPEDQFSDDELASRSQALYQIGSVRLEQGNSEAAVEAFAESLRLARALSERTPDDPERLFGLSQSHFYVGYASWREGDLEAADAQFMGYLEAAERLVAMDPASLDYRLELGFAHGNLGAVREERGDLTGAEAEYLLTLDALSSLVETDSTNVNWLGELAETHNKLGVVLRKGGDYAGALEQHTRELDLKRGILELEPGHAYWRTRSAVALGFLAAVMRATGRLDESLVFLQEEIAVLDSLISSDPSNTTWRRDQAVTRTTTAEVLRSLGRAADARVELDEAERELSALVRTDSTAFGWHVDLADVFTQRSGLLLEESRADAALTAAGTALELIGGEPDPTTGRAFAVAKAHLARGHALELLGREADARDEWERSLGAMEPFTESVDRGEFRPLLAEGLLLLDRTVEAQEELTVLAATGYVDPALTRLAERKAVPR